MKQNMIKRIIGSAAALALVAGFVGCGSDEIPSGQVTKGPVDGAEVYGRVNGEDNVFIAKTDNNGKFKLFGEPPFTTKGGKYVDLATGVLTDAPPLKAPAGAKNITPITTLIAENPNDPALLNMIKSFGIAFDDPLTTVTAANKDAIALSECIGAAIVEIKKKGGRDNDVKKFLENVADKVKTLTVTSGNADLEQIGTKMKEAATASLSTDLAASVSATLTATYEAAAILIVGNILPTVTPTTPVPTGGTGGTGGGTGNGL